MLSWLIENTLVASALAVVLLASSRWLEKRPAVGNFGWLLVIVLLVMPPMPKVFSPGVRRTVTAPVAWVGSFFDADERSTKMNAAPRSRGYAGGNERDWAGDEYPAEASADLGPETAVVLGDGPTKASTAEMGLGTRQSETPSDLGVRTVTPPLAWPGNEQVASAETPLTTRPQTTDHQKADRQATNQITRPVRQDVATADRADATGTVSSDPVSSLASLPARSAGADTPQPDSERPAALTSQATPQAVPVSPPANRGEARRATSPRVTLAMIGVIGLVAWLIGFVIVAARQTGRVRSMRSLEKDANRDEALDRRVRAVAERVGIRPPRTIVSDLVDGPMVWSLGRSVLVWPAGTPVDAVGADGMIAHELAHLRRGDHWAAWLELAALTLFWWHPLVWLAHRRAREFAELACDAWVSWALPTDRRAYAEALVSAASKRAELESRGGRGGPALAFGVVESSRDDFKRRLTMVMTGRGSRRLPPAIAAAGLGLVMMLAPSVAGELTAKPPAEVQIEGLGLIDDVFHPALEQMAYLRVAKRLEQAGDIDGSVDAYMSAIDLGAQAHGDLAMMMYYAERWEDGQEAFAEAYKHDNDADSLYNAACCAALGGNERDAVKLLKRAVAAGYTDGRHMMNDSDLESVHSNGDVEKLAELADSIQELYDLAQEAVEEQAWGEAAKAYGKLTDLVPDDHENLSMAAYASIMGGELDAGRNWLEQQMDAGFMVSTAKYNLACINALEGNTSDAIDWLEEAVDEGFDSYQLMRKDEDLASIRDTDRYAAAQRAAARPDRLRREMELAADFWEWDQVVDKAESLIAMSDGEDDWSTMQARQMLAEAYQHQGDYQGAIEQLLESAKSGNNSHGTMMSIARNYAEAGKVRKAAAYVAAVIETNGHQGGNISLGDGVYVGNNFNFDGNFSFNGNFTVGTGSSDDQGGVMEAVYEHKLVRAALDRQRERDELSQFDAGSWRELEASARERLAEDGEDSGAYLELGWALLRQMELDDAIDAFEGLGEHGSKQLSAYNIACCHAQAGDKDEAFEFLNKAVSLGFADMGQYASDPDLAPLHEDSRWESLMGDLKATHRADAVGHDHDEGDHDHDDDDWDEGDWDDDDDADWRDEDSLDEI